MTTIYSHSKNGVGYKLLKVHTNGVTDKALGSLYKHVSFTIPYSELLSLLKEVCIYHDLGKYTEFFQDYLLNRKQVPNELKQHARLGAFALFEKYKNTHKWKAVLAYYLIVNHHKSLSDITLTEFSDDNDPKHQNYKQAIFPKQKKSVLDIILIIQSETNESQLETFLNIPEGKVIRNEVKSVTRNNADIQNYFLINYLFSLLIEADKLDASETQLYSRVSISSDVIDKQFPLKSITSTDLKSFSQNELRNYVRKIVSGELAQPDILNKRLFTLTAPTGIGKTLTALDFALKLRQQIRLKENREAQIIYGLPFINIIEQSIDVYTTVLQDSNVQILAHYQYADALEQLKNDDEEQKIQGYNQALMTLDTWQCDIVITSFVQLLQTLIGNRNKLLKKFNHFAGSIIILDEVQTIRLGLQPLIGASLFYLSKFLDARILMMTATKPKIFELAQQEILDKKGIRDKIDARELLPDFASVFECFQRTKIVPLIDSQLNDEQDFLAIFKDKWATEKSCLIVCNKVKRSIDVFSTLQEYLQESNLTNPLYYLSTNIIPTHRLAIIKKIKSDLSANIKPILISTQVVEAGVDLDFDMGFRDLAPIDSIIQVAGRINRNNHPAKKYSPLYIINLGDCQKIYDPITESKAKDALNSAEIREDQYLSMIDKYFDKVANNSSFEVSRKFFESMQSLRYDGENKSEYPVSHFKIIDEKGFAISVFIEIDDRATECRKMFFKMITKEVSKSAFEPYKRDFNQRIIAVPKYLSKVTELIKTASWLVQDSILWVKNEHIQEYYDLVTGFKRDNETKETFAFL